MFAAPATRIWPRALRGPFHASLPKTKFAADSALEGDGFEPSVPGTKEPVFVAEGELRDRTGAAKKSCILCGTDGSNPSPSSGESFSADRFCGSRRMRPVLLGRMRELRREKAIRRLRS